MFERLELNRKGLEVEKQDKCEGLGLGKLLAQEERTSQVKVGDAFEDITCKDDELLVVDHILGKMKDYTSLLLGSYLEAGSVEDLGEGLEEYLNNMLKGQMGFGKGESFVG